MVQPEIATDRSDLPHLVESAADDVCALCGRRAGDPLHQPQLFEQAAEMIQTEKGS